jgi:putative inorganic carbon (hco3(-)) transporter
VDGGLNIPIVRPGRRRAAKPLKKLFFIDKLNSPLGYTLLTLFFLAIGIGVAQVGIVFGVIALVPFIVIPLVYALIAYPRFGIVVFLVMAYLIMFIMRMGIIPLPLGTLMDAMEGIFVLSVFINQRKRKDWTMFKGPISVMILVWMGYNFIEVINPTADSRMAWLYTVRTVAIVMLTYFIFVYYITTREYIRLIFKLWIGLALFAALYAFKQDHIGFFGFEEMYLHSNPIIETLFFIGGVWRKFSIFSDPVAFAYNMVTASMICIGMLSAPLSGKKKLILWGLILFFWYVMLSSGTRGAYVLIPVSLLLLAVLKYRRVVILWILVGAAFAVGLIYMPTSNPTLYRFQSAFKPSDDASFNVRAINQKRIQPYILAHPLGGGLGATGIWGQKFSPGSYLSNFPPDSGYVRVAVEMGWMGLLIFCIFMYTALHVGISNYYKIKDPELKAYCLGSVLVIFSLNFGNYPQEALVQYPSNIYFYLVLAMVVITRRLDSQQDLLNGK